MATVISGDFEWDDAKAISNLEKHGVSFEEAALALASDDLEYSYQDPDEPIGFTRSSCLHERVFY